MNKTSVRQLALEGKIRLAYFRYRGDVNAIAQQSNVPLDQVIKITERIKKQCSKDVSEFVAERLHEELLLGRAQRIQYIQKTLEYLVSIQDDVEEVSRCCDAAVMYVDKIPKCTLCNKQCVTRIYTHFEIQELIDNKIKLLLEEDIALVDFVDKLGIVKGKEGPKITQNVLVLGDGEKDKRIVDDALKLTGLDREVVRQKLLKVIAAELELTKLDKEISNDKSGKI